jgi:hypothetical protein
MALPKLPPVPGADKAEDECSVSDPLGIDDS